MIEYKVVTFNEASTKNGDQFTKWLNEHGKDGWDCFGFQNIGGTNMRFMFKRQAKSAKPLPKTVKK